MDTIFIDFVNDKYVCAGDIPETGRGRALYTVDWFVNGTVRLVHHDSYQVTIAHCLAR